MRLRGHRVPWILVPVVALVFAWPSVANARPMHHAHHRHPAKVCAHKPHPKRCRRRHRREHARHHGHKPRRAPMQPVPMPEPAVAPCTAWLLCDPAPTPCTPGEAECLELTSRVSFPMYGNARYADCEYAAAADWEIIALGIEPSEPEVIGAYLEVASGTLASQGITDLWTWWPDRGLDGIHVQLDDALYRSTMPSPNEPTPEALRDLVRARGALLATLIDPESTTGLMHEVAIDGFTPIGPTVISWGAVHQMTWAEWQEVAFTVEIPEEIGT